MSESNIDRAVPARRVLVVDDEPPVSSALKMVLVSRGYTVEIAEDGRAALRAFKLGKHDLIITDYALGSMTGLDLAKAIREEFPTQPIIMISAYAESLALRNDRLANVNLLLGKPFSLKEIMDALAVVFPKT
jgi:CheY-like chemotaxis protein